MLFGCDSFFSSMGVCSTRNCHCCGCHISATKIRLVRWTDQWPGQRDGLGNHCQRTIWRKHGTSRTIDDGLHHWRHLGRLWLATTRANYQHDRPPVHSVWRVVLRSRQRSLEIGSCGQYFSTGWLYRYFNRCSTAPTTASVTTRVPVAINFASRQHHHRFNHSVEIARNPSTR